MINSIAELNKMVSNKVTDLVPSGNRGGLFRKLRTMQKTAQDFYDLNFDVKVYKGYEKIKLPIARQLVDVMVNQLPLYKPKIEVIPFKDTKAYQHKADKQSQFFAALLLDSLSQTDPPIPTAGKYIGLRGEAFLKSVYDVGVLEGIPKDEDEKAAYLINHFPLKLICPDPMNCYPSSEHIDCRPVDMIEINQVFASDIRRVWPDWKSSKSDSDLVVFVEYWDNEKYVCLANGKPLTKDFEDNEYHITPYVHVYSGWGVKTATNDPEKKAINLIFECQDLIKQQCREFSYHDRALAFASTPMIHTSKEHDEVLRESSGVELKIEPGMVLYGDERVEVTWAANNLPAGIQSAIMMNQSMIDRVQAGILRGETTGIASGVQAEVLLGQARRGFDLPLENLKILIARALETMQIIVSQMGTEELSIWGANKALSLSKEDCTGAFRYKVDFETLTFEGKLAQAVGLAGLRQGGDVSLKTALELNPLVDDPEFEYNLIQAEKMLKHPAWQDKISVDALKELGQPEQAALLSQAMAEGAAGEVRKAESSGIPVGGRLEQPTPTSVIEQAIMGRRKRIQRGEVRETR